jgi:TRAP-type C4-dicarboxylate transport system permease small subunit
MPAVASSQARRTAHWYGIVLRVLLATFIGTLIFFAASLLVGIFGTVIVSALRGIHPDMRIAYRMIALPIAGVAGAIVFVLSSIMEIRHYRQSKALSGIERMG